MYIFVKLFYSTIHRSFSFTFTHQVNYVKFTLEK